MEKDRIEKATQTITEKLQEGDAALERDDIMGAVTAFAAAMQIYETMTAPTSLALAELESAQIPRGLGSQARIKLHDAQELELQGQSEPHFANHSMRRFADRVARETRGETGASVMEIDIVFGWNEAQRRKDMQLHYAGLDRAQRVGFARVTMCI